MGDWLWLTESFPAELTEKIDWSDGPAPVEQKKEPDRDQVFEEKFDTIDWSK